jgi:hypothetical protein
VLQKPTVSPFEALGISTTNTYAFLGELDKAGIIEPGKIADLVRKIFGVMTQKRWISKTGIDKRLKERADSYTKLRQSKFN